MAQQRRMIYAQILENFEFSILSPNAKVLYIFLIVLADDEGRLKANPVILKGRIFPFNDDITSDQVKELLGEVLKARLIIYYEIEKEGYLQHPRWEKYQKLRKDLYKLSNLPDQNGVVTLPLQFRNADVTQVSKKVSKKEGNFSKGKIKKEMQQELTSDGGSNISELLQKNKPEFLK